MLVPVTKIKDLVLPYNVFNYLFRKVLNYLACRRDITIGKTINLLNKDMFLGVSKVLVNFRLKINSRASLAFLAVYNRRMNKLVLCSNLIVISNSRRFDFS
jgi:hypothetical protein